MDKIARYFIHTLQNIYLYIHKTTPLTQSHVTSSRIEHPQYARIIPNRAPINGHARLRPRTRTHIAHDRGCVWVSRAPFFFMFGASTRRSLFPTHRAPNASHRIDDDDDDDVVVDATVRDAHGHRTWDERKRSHRARASAASAVRAPTRDWCVNDRGHRLERARAILD